MNGDKDMLPVVAGVYPCNELVVDPHLHEPHEGDPVECLHPSHGPVEPLPDGASRDALRYGWCTRCGQRYAGAVEPTCECAGDPPVGRSGARLPNFHPDQVAYLNRVKNLRHGPAGGV